MRLTLSVATFMVVLSLTTYALAERDTQHVDFNNDLIPVFTKNGCNAGACHGAAIGRGGFKLSLYGGDPRADFESIARQVRGRRINLAAPEDSLIVLKPTGSIEHGGDQVFSPNSESTRLLVDWIQQGAQRESNRSLEEVLISPQRHVAERPGETISLRAIASYSDGTARDVTNWTIFKAEDDSAVKIANETAVATILRRGRHIVVARYLNEVIPIELIVPLTDSLIEPQFESSPTFIDEEIDRTLATLGLPPSPSVDDSTFLRRVSLDLTGRLPTAERVQSFLKSKDSHKRKDLVDKLLRSDEFTEYWTFQFAKLLRIRPQRGDDFAASTYFDWLANQVESDASYQELARMLITASGDTHQYGPASFFRTVAGPREQAEFVSELFMGSRLRCANCHNHPLDRWTQDDYHGLAAIFAQVETGQVIREKPSGEIVHPRTLEPAIPRIPGERFLETGTSDARQQLASWLTDPGNSIFAKAIVNRLWKQMMGRGLVEPVDDFRATNPATHPELLERLAADFIAGGYSIRHTLQTIAESKAYARRSNATAENKDDDRFYSHALRTPLEPEVLADAISDVLEVAERYGEEPLGTRSVTLVNPKTPSRTLDILGRCSREESCESNTAKASGLSQKLHLFNGELLNARIAANGSRLPRLQKEGRSPLEIIEEFYTVALSRLPTDMESDYWQSQLESSNDQQAFLEDFVWSILASHEFVTNH